MSSDIIIMQLSLGIAYTECILQRFKKLILWKVYTVYRKMLFSLISKTFVFFCPDLVCIWRNVGGKLCFKIKSNRKRLELRSDIGLTRLSFSCTTFERDCHQIRGRHSTDIHSHPTSEVLAMSGMTFMLALVLLILISFRVLEGGWNAFKTNSLEGKSILSHVRWTVSPQNWPSWTNPVSSEIFIQIVL
jgi:hypothetical protein